MADPHPQAHLLPIAEMALELLKVVGRDNQIANSPSGMLIALGVTKMALDGDEITPTSITRETQLPKSTVTRILHSFIACGLLEEQQTAQDRRRKILRPGPGHVELLGHCTTMIEAIAESHWGEQAVAELKKAHSAQPVGDDFTAQVKGDSELLRSS